MSEVVQIGDATLYHGDCLEILPTLPKVDAVITDPPYGIAYQSARRVGGPTGMLANDDTAPLESVPLMAEKIKVGGALYLATRFDVVPDWIEAVAAAGLTLKTPVYWDKGNHTSGDLEGDFGGRVEIFLFAHKGRHLLRGKRHDNLWRFPRDPAGEHPTPKPVNLIGRMVDVSTDIGATVLDPFMGSGSTGLACMGMNRRFIGIEIERRYFDIACERIDNAYRQTRLFA